MKSYVAHARRWAHGWELHVDGIGVTQVRTLDQAEAQVRDLIETMTDRSALEDEIELLVELGDLTSRVAHVRGLTRQAAELQQVAAAESREVVQELRAAQLSISDIAHMMGVSRGRASQLLSPRSSPTIAVEYAHTPVRTRRFKKTA